MFLCLVIHSSRDCLHISLTLSSLATKQKIWTSECMKISWTLFYFLSLLMPESKCQANQLEVQGATRVTNVHWTVHRNNRWQPIAHPWPSWATGGLLMKRSLPTSNRSYKWGHKRLREAHSVIQRMESPMTLAVFGPLLYLARLSAAHGRSSIPSLLIGKEHTAPIRVLSLDNPTQWRSSPFRVHRHSIKPHYSRPRASYNPIFTPAHSLLPPIFVQTTCLLPPVLWPQASSPITMTFVTPIAYVRHTRRSISISSCFFKCSQSDLFIWTLVEIPRCEDGQYRA